MPPRRSARVTRPVRYASPSSSESSPSLPPPSSPRSRRVAEIQEAFRLFALHSVPGYEDCEPEGVMRAEDVRRCLISLNLPTSTGRRRASPLDTLDPTGTGIVSWDSFHEYANSLFRLHGQTPSRGKRAAESEDEEDDDAPMADDDAGDDDEDYAGAGGGGGFEPESGSGEESGEEEQADIDEAEVLEAFGLFTRKGPGPITLAHLRRVARELKEEVSDEVLKDMILEANGERGEGWRKGVGVEEFGEVMRRAGVFG